MVAVETQDETSAPIVSCNFAPFWKFDGQTDRPTDRSINHPTDQQTDMRDNREVTHATRKPYLLILRFKPFKDVKGIEKFVHGTLPWSNNLLFFLHHHHHPFGFDADAVIWMASRRELRTKVCLNAFVCCYIIN